MPCTLSLVLYKSKIETNEWSLQRRMTGQFCTLAIFGIWNAWIINKVVGSLLGKLSRRLQSCKVLSAHCCYHDHHLTEQIYTRNHKGCFSAFLICRNSREVYLQASSEKISVLKVAIPWMCQCEILNQDIDTLCLTIYWMNIRWGVQCCIFAKS